MDNKKASIFKVLGYTIVLFFIALIFSAIFIDDENNNEKTLLNIQEQSSTTEDNNLIAQQIMDDLLKDIPHFNSNLYRIKDNYYTKDRIDRGDDINPTKEIYFDMNEVNGTVSKADNTTALAIKTLLASPTDNPFSIAILNSSAASIAPKTEAPATGDFVAAVTAAAKPNIGTLSAPKANIRVNEKFSVKGIGELLKNSSLGASIPVCVASSQF